MSGRALISQRRTVSASLRPRYVELWRALAEATRERGAHAWHFAAAGEPSVFIEFLEFPAGADPRNAGGVADALTALVREIGGPETEEEWVEP